MVAHDILVNGVTMTGTEQKPPTLLQMHNDDFPTRFLEDLGKPSLPAISSTTSINTAAQPLFQPVQRMLNVAMVKLSCDSLSYPRLDPTRIESAGIVIRRIVLKPSPNNGPAIEDPSAVSAWMRSATGQFAWIPLRPDQETLDPEPTLRPQLYSGQPTLDRRLAALSLSSAYTESTTPAFAVPPASSARLGRTVFYGVIPTASSEVSDAQPKTPPLINKADLLDSLPGLLRYSALPPTAPLPGSTIDSRWMSGDFVNSLNLGSSVAPFNVFTSALFMLHSVFGAFEGTAEGNKILTLLNNRKVTFGVSPNTATMRMGDFYNTAKACLIDRSTSSLLMPTAWEALTQADETAILQALSDALTPRSQNILAPQGRFQDSTRRYRLRMFFRIKGESPACPTKLVWSQYSDPFRIAAWYEGSQRSHPPVPLPDLNTMTKDQLKPNCSFHVPGSLMGAMQGASMSGLMKGAGGGAGLKLDWICGFNIPLITICAFFVLNIFLSLLNIIFFWLPFIKICIPFPVPAPSSPDEGTP
jgi:hypothetical protein